MCHAVSRVKGDLRVQKDACSNSGIASCPADAAHSNSEQSLLAASSKQVLVSNQRRFNFLRASTVQDTQTSTVCRAFHGAGGRQHDTGKPKRLAGVRHPSRELRLPSARPEDLPAPGSGSRGRRQGHLIQQAMLTDSAEGLRRPRMAGKSAARWDCSCTATHLSAVQLVSSSCAVHMVACSQPHADCGCDLNYCWTAGGSAAAGGATLAPAVFECQLHFSAPATRRPFLITEPSALCSLLCAFQLASQQSPPARPLALFRATSGGNKSRVWRRVPRRREQRPWSTVPSCRRRQPRR